PAEVRLVEVQPEEVRPAEVRPAEVRLGEVQTDFEVLDPPLVPGNHALLEHRDMLVVRHGSTPMAEQVLILREIEVLSCRFDHRRRDGAGYIFYELFGLWEASQ